MDTPELDDGQRVLVVEDDDGTIRVLGQVLRGLDCTASVARSVAEARASLNDAREHGEPFRAVLLDLHLEDREDGLGVLEHAREAAPDTDVILCTGSPEVRPEDPRWQRMGFRGVVKKPFRVSDISRTIRAVL